MASFFERGEPDDLMLDLQTVYAVLADETLTPPDNFSVRATLESMKVAEPLSEYAGNINRLIEELLDKKGNQSCFWQGVVV